MTAEPLGPHTDYCPMRRPRAWRAIFDKFATCHCSNHALGAILRGAR